MCIDSLVKDIELSLRLRRFWLWTTILWLSVCIASPWGPLPAFFIPFAWAAFGLLAGGLIANIGNSNPIFIRSFGDAVYMLQNSLIFLSKAKALDSPIFIGLFGTSFYKVIPVSEKTLARLIGSEIITLNDSSIVSIGGQRSLYLLLKDSNILYGFPDYKTLIDFNEWVAKKNIKLKNSVDKPLRYDGYKEITKKYVLGPPLVSSAFWKDEIWRHI